MRKWLLTLLGRVGTHNNLKVRKFVQKKSLSRKYISVPMAPFFFSTFIGWLNMCLLFKDVTSLVQFSKNAHLVIDFYARYFRSESPDPARDLCALLTAFARIKSSSQMYLILFKTLSTDFGV
jgi:hypothetical protein